MWSPDPDWTQDHSKRSYTVDVVMAGLCLFIILVTAWIPVEIVVTICVMNDVSCDIGPGTSEDLAPLTVGCLSVVPR